MADHTLVVTNPPQGGVDVERTASYLGLTPEQIRSKANYHIPEIWAADTDPPRMEDAAAHLREAGCKVVVLSSDELVNVPPQRRVRSFSFTDDGLVAHVDGADIPVPYGEEMVAVFCRPREAPYARTSGQKRTSGFMSLRDRLTERVSGPHDVREADATPFFDIYVGGPATPTRISVVQNAVSFAGLGRLQPRAAANMELLVERCEDRFSHGTVDRRLEGMRLRLDRLMKRASLTEQRRGFSFASPKLAELLSRMSPTMEGITQPELSTRLAYLTRSHLT